MGKQLVLKSQHYNKILKGKIHSQQRLYLLRLTYMFHLGIDIELDWNYLLCNNIQHYISLLAKRPQ
jgi:hypothetical protein